MTTPTLFSQNDASGSDGKVDLRHIIRTTIRTKFPLAPTGTHKAICTDVEIADSTFANAQPGDKVIRFTWELSVANSKDPSRPKKFTVRSKSFGVYLSVGSALVQLINTLTGRDISYTAVDHDEEGNPVIDFDAGVFIGMKADVVITHVEQFGKTYANIAEFLTNDEQMAENAKRLSV